MLRLLTFPDHPLSSPFKGRQNIRANVCTALECPLPTALVSPLQPPIRLAPPQAGVRFDRLTAGGSTGSPQAVRPAHRRRFDRLTAGGSTGSPQVGKPGFPMSQPLVGAAGASTGRGMGKPGFPVLSPQSTGTACRPEALTPAGSSGKGVKGCGESGFPRCADATRHFRGMNALAHGAQIGYTHQDEGGEESVEV